MKKKERYRALHIALLMDIMNIQRPEPFDLDVAREPRELVEFALVGAPVVAVLPLVDQTFQVGERDAVVPAGIVYFIRKAGLRKLAAKEGKSIIWYRNLEGAFRCHVIR
jgi:hypothetical protein